MDGAPRPINREDIPVTQVMMVTLDTSMTDGRLLNNRHSVIFLDFRAMLEKEDVDSPNGGRPVAA
jgi:hypothetical protein